MSAALKIASLASGLTVFSFSALHTMRNSQQDFSKSALALEHTFESQAQAGSVIKPKLPSNFVSLTVGGYELTNKATA